MAVLLSAPASAPAVRAPDGTPTRTIRSGEFHYQIQAAPAYVETLPLPEHWTGADTRTGDRSSRDWLDADDVDLRGEIDWHYHDRIFEPLNPQALAAAAQQRIAFDPRWQQLVLHRIEIFRDGSWQDRLDPAQITLARREQSFEEQIYDGQVTALIVLDDVRVHDRIRIAYSLGGRHPVVGRLGLRGFNFGWTDPVLERRVRLLAPASPGLAVRVRGGEIKHSQTTLADGSIELRAVASDLSPLKFADQAPDWVPQVPMLYVAEHHDWAQIAAWAVTLFPPAEDRAALRAITEPIRKAHPQPAAQVLATLRFVQDEIRYFGTEFGASTHQPAPPELVLQRRYGDCKDKSRLLVDLLGELGIEAAPALVDTDLRRALEQMPASAGVFDHAIVSVVLDGERYWLDPTRTLQRGGLDQLGFADYERALLVESGSKGLTTIREPGAVRDALEVVEQIQPSPAQTEDAELEVISVWRGALAEYIRRELASHGAQAMSENYRQFYSRAYGNANALSGIEVEDLETHNQVTVTERYRIEKFWKREGNQAYADVYAQSIGQFVALPEQVNRTLPLAQLHPLKIHHRMHLTLPAEARIEVEQPSRKLGDPAWNFEYRGDFGGGKVKLEFDYRSLNDTIDAAAVTAHLAQRRELIDALSQRVVFRWPTAIAAEREQRLRGLLDQIEGEN